MILAPSSRVRRSRLSILVAGLAVGLAGLGSGLEGSAGPRVFVTNERSNDVSVIDAATGQVLQTIAVGKHPRGVAVSSDRHRVYVSNGDSNDVTVLDAVTLAVLRTTAAGRDPAGLSVSRDGTRLYVANKNEAAVTVLEATSLREVAKLPAGTEPEMTVVSPDGQWVALIQPPPARPTTAPGISLAFGDRHPSHAEIHRWTCRGRCPEGADCTAWDQPTPRVSWRLGRSPEHGSSPSESDEVLAKDRGR